MRNVPGMTFVICSTCKRLVVLNDVVVLLQGFPTCGMRTTSGA